MRAALSAKKFKTTTVSSIFFKDWKQIALIKNPAQNASLFRAEQLLQLIKLVSVTCHILKLSVMHVWPQRFL